MLTGSGMACVASAGVVGQPRLRVSLTNPGVQGVTGVVGGVETEYVGDGVADDGGDGLAAEALVRLAVAIGRCGGTRVRHGHAEVGDGAPGRAAGQLRGVRDGDPPGGAGVLAVADPDEQATVADVGDADQVRSSTPDRPLPGDLARTRCRTRPWMGLQAT